MSKVTHTVILTQKYPKDKSQEVIDLKGKILKILKEYGIIFIGCLIYAVAFNWLFVPNNIVMGGFTGVAQTLNHLIPVLPIGTVILVMNIPLFAIGIKLQGKKLLFSSVFAMVVSSLAIDILPQFIEFKPVNDQLMACVLGGALAGSGFGLLLWVGATTGGTELAATLLKYKFKHVQIGRLCLLIDVCIIGIYGIVFNSLNDALYGIISMYVCSTAIDSVIYGRKTSKVACIICDNGEQLMQDLIQMDLGITEIQARGGFTQSDKKVLICAFKPSRISILKKAVIQKDPNAFVIVCDAQEVYGEGFAECMLNSL